mgnify:CR=1 FL=1
MKKLFVTLAFLAVSLISNAQFFVAGSVSASHSSSKTVYVNHETDYDPRYDGFSVTPAVGYMIWVMHILQEKRICQKISLTLSISDLSSVMHTQDLIR